jgi:hypothetical protein
MTRRGTIKNMDEYLDGKKFDHGDWVDFAPRNMTPTNIDGVLDDDGYELILEASRATYSWDQFSKEKKGQIRYFNRRVRDGRGTVIVVLVLLDTPRGEVSNTIRDVTDFSVIYFREDVQSFDDTCRETYHGNETWKRFLRHWFGNHTVMPN